MKRREFITLLGGAAAWPLAARAQQADRVRRIGALFPIAESDPEQAARRAALQQTLERLGWMEGKNVQLDFRFAGGPDRFSPLAKEIVAQQPDVIFAQTPGVVAAVKRETQTIPIVFANVSDPIGAGFVTSLARPGGSITGMQLFEASIAGKWLSMLKEIAPQLKRATLMGNPKTTAFDYFLQIVEAAAPSLELEVTASRVANADEITRTIESPADAKDAGLVLAPDSTNLRNRDLIIGLAARHRIPAVYPERNYVLAGGLMSYGIADLVEPFRQAASYVDRILRGAQPADLPVQAPTKYQTVINLKTARALGLTVPPGLLVAADEVVE
jgi:putative tryptophan/tyrosine transport system substrate-binding protein